MRAREFTTEAPIAPGIFKYEQNPRKDRVPILLQKLETESPFTIIGKNGLEQVVFDPTQYSEVATHLKNKNRRFSLKTLDGRIIPFGAIVKTKEFGGEMAGQREKIEQDQINTISTMLEKAKAGKASIELRVGNRIVDVARVVKTPELIGGRAPKSDMSVLDIQGKPVAWVSLKGRPFRWGGWNHLTMMPEISQWIDRIKQETGNEFEPGQSYGLHISDDIIHRIIFGKDFGTGKPGISNVDTVLIGEPTIEKNKDGVFSLEAATEYKNGETPTGQDTPYLVMRYMLGRPDLGFKNARAETNTKSETRRVKWLDSQVDVVPVTTNKQHPTPGVQNQQVALNVSQQPMGQTQNI
jgi:hypothetical protein